jgi:hypothetical protein
MTDARKVPVSVRLMPELARRLRAAAIAQGVPLTRLVEQACEAAPWGREPAARCPIHNTPTRQGACQECDGGLF